MEWYQLQITTPGTLNVIQYAMPLVLIAFNIVYAAKYLHKQCELVQYIIFKIKLHISARFKCTKQMNWRKYYVLTLYQYDRLYK